MEALNREEILEKLKPLFQLGMSISKACDTSGICDDQTIQNWIKEDSTISMKIKMWQGYVSSKAREIVALKINEEGDIEAAKWWLERKEKKEFSNRTEVTGEDGVPIGESENVKQISLDLKELFEKYGNNQEPRPTQ